MIIKPYPYQEKAINSIASSYGKGLRSVLLQAPTGSGKTVTISELVRRWLISFDSTVYMTVHRDSLLKQAYVTMKKINPTKKIAIIIADYQYPIDPKTKKAMLDADINIAMVESFYNRVTKGKIVIPEKALLISDECHIASFNKMYEPFEGKMRIGLSATPISSNKRKPLKNYYEEIISPVSIKELQKLKKLSKNETITIKNGIDRNILKTKGNDFDVIMMSEVYKQTRHVVNCRKAYEMTCLGERTLIFNVNVEHSELVNEEFLRHGINSRHLDGNHSKDYRKKTLKWFEETSDAVLCSVDLFTTGLDITNIQSVIFNRATMSLPLWLQGGGRGSRIDKKSNKYNFKIVDLGSNVATHLDWDYPHDWKMYFHNPEKVRAGKGVAPTKNCPECDALIHLSVDICPFCLSTTKKEIKYDMGEIELQSTGKNINLYYLAKYSKSKNPYQVLHIIKGKIVSSFKKKYEGTIVTENTKHRLNKVFQKSVKEWCKTYRKPYDEYHQNKTKKDLYDEIERRYGK